MSVNKVILVGNVGKDPEVRYLDGGNVVAKFSFATSESYKNKSGERITQTEWHNIVLWRAQAEFAEKYITKGKQLYIEGRIKTRSWEDKEGNKRYTTEIYGDNLRILSKRSDFQDTSGSNDPQGNKPAENEKTDKSNEDDALYDDATNDDLPF